MLLSYMRLLPPVSALNKIFCTSFSQFRLFITKAPGRLLVEVASSSTSTARRSCWTVGCIWERKALKGMLRLLVVFLGSITGIEIYLTLSYWQYFPQHFFLFVCLFVVPDYSIRDLYLYDNILHRNFLRFTPPTP